MEKFNKVIAKVDGLFEYVGGLFCFLLMISVVLQVLGRYFFKHDLIPGIYNIIESYLFPIVVLLALGGSYRVELWPKLDIFIEQLDPAKRRSVNLVTLSIEFLLYFLITIFTANYALKMVNEGRLMQAGATMYPLYPVLCIVPFAFFILSLEIIIKIYKAKDKQV
ncbi:hypothetical protein DSCW_05110 [Desulfosarcina widdelii]|uniref:Tripartite ATP-independent periplasmic transporters DctQ component domain-containing protein n=1 Tax=Desulfosarcina widdelii TaxID=947919 RepID=A0A5K7Z3N9_9BACT|nr:TRAP transporter small permease subunit [Desulfosarcina widdelii]BBO73094.1 hypothetical protein DSCW_05110 [Desulfosarcina widdelii]